MARTADVWLFSVRTSAKLGRLVRLGDIAVPEAVTVNLVSDDNVDGLRWPEVTVEYRIRDGAIACVSMHLVSRPGDRPIRSSDLKVVDLQWLGEEAFRRHARHEIPGGWATKAEEPKAAHRDVHAAYEASYGQSMDELRQVARYYLDPAARAAPRQSVQGLMGGSVSTAKRKIRSAREAGLIPPLDATDAELDAAWQRLVDHERNRE